MKWILFLCFICSAFASDPSQKDKPATVKVLLERQTPEITLEMKGRHSIFNPLDGTQISSNILSKKAKLCADAYQEMPCIKWGDKFPYHQLRFVPGDSKASILVNGIQYRGCLEVYMNDGKFSLINEVDVETYLKSTLSSFFPQPLHEEVLNALAIVARTHAYFMGQRQKQAFWHVVAHDVGYKGAAALPKPAIEKAVESTRHAILTYKGDPFAATWTQNSAGKTADFAAIFRKAVTSPPGVTAPIAAKDRDQSAWTCSLSKSLLAHATDLSTVTSIDLYVAPDTEKVYAIKVTGEAEVKDFDFVTFQKILGPNNLRSNDFTVKAEEDKLVFSGYGDGPGCGLCLYSAKVMAEKGDKAPQILQAFFPDTHLEKIKHLLR
jgi:stage II sporulation protein D